MNSRTIQEAFAQESTTLAAKTAGDSEVWSRLRFYFRSETDRADKAQREVQQLRNLVVKMAEAIHVGEEN